MAKDITLCLANGRVITNAQALAREKLIVV